MAWAKSRAAARFDLAGSNVLACSIEDLDGAREALDLSGRNDNGYEPLADAIARRYGVPANQVATAQGTSGANFLVCAALLSPGDDVVVERPAYDPLLAAPRMLGARVLRFDRPFDDRYALHPDRIAAALTPRTRLIVITSPHNPAGVVAGRDALLAVGRLAEARGAHVLVDEVYMDVANEPAPPAATLGDTFISTSSLTKSYGLSALRCGWALASPAVAERIRRARDVVDGTGSIVVERLAVVAFAQIDRLLARARGVCAPTQTLTPPLPSLPPRCSTRTARSSPASCAAARSWTGSSRCRARSPSRVSAAWTTRTHSPNACCASGTRRSCRAASSSHPPTSAWATRSSRTAWPGGSTRSAQRSGRKSSAEPAATTA
jgi:hypothetical protein